MMICLGRISTAGLSFILSTIPIHDVVVAKILEIQAR
jgi:hypothetical protein